MYSRYISDRHGDDKFVPASVSSDFQIPVQRPQPVHDHTEERLQESPAKAAPASAPIKSLLGNLFGKKDGKSGTLGNLFGGFNLGDLDIGDIILILILILMFLDSDEYDFLIIIGLIVFLGL